LQTFALDMCFQALDMLPHPKAAPQESTFFF
jgi:hypothetical protein